MDFSMGFRWILTISMNFLVLNLWDCGGQESFMEQYFASQKDNIFRNVEVLIYVFDVESRELDNDMHYYQSCLEAIYKVNLFIIFGLCSYQICNCLFIAQFNLAQSSIHLYQF